MSIIPLVDVFLVFSEGEVSSKSHSSVILIPNCLCSLLGALWFQVLFFRSLIHFEFIFLHGMR